MVVDLAGLVAATLAFAGLPLFFGGSAASSSSLLLSALAGLPRFLGTVVVVDVSDPKRMLALIACCARQSQVRLNVLFAVALTGAAAIVVGARRGRSAAAVASISLPRRVTMVAGGSVVAFDFVGVFALFVDAVVVLAFLGGILSARVRCRECVAWVKWNRVATC